LPQELSLQAPPPRSPFRRGLGYARARALFRSFGRVPADPSQIPRPSFSISRQLPAPTCPSKASAIFLRVALETKRPAFSQCAVCFLPSSSSLSSPLTPPPHYPNRPRQEDRPQKPFPPHETHIFCVLFFTPYFIPATEKTAAKKPEHRPNRRPLPPSSSAPASSPPFFRIQIEQSFSLVAQASESRPPFREHPASAPRPPGPSSRRSRAPKRLASQPTMLPPSPKFRGKKRNPSRKKPVFSFFCLSTGLRRN